jgi:hypothetical protein
LVLSTHNPESKSRTKFFYVAWDGWSIPSSDLLRARRGLVTLA